MVHWLHQCSGSIRVASGGELVDVAPLEEVVLNYPGLGVGRAWTVGHPESVTLVGSGARSSRNVMTTDPATIAVLRGLAARIDVGEIDAHEAARLLLTGAFPAPSPDVAGEDSGAALPPLFAHVTGTVARRPAVVAATVLALPPKGMGGAPGVPLAVGLSLLHRGQFAGPGVWPPERAVDARTFFDELAPHCSPARTGVDELVLVSRADG